MVSGKRKSRQVHDNWSLITLSSSYCSRRSSCLKKEAISTQVNSVRDHSSFTNYKSSGQYYIYETKNAKRDHCQIS